MCNLYLNMLPQIKGESVDNTKVSMQRSKTWNLQLLCLQSAWLMVSLDITDWSALQCFIAVDVNCGHQACELSLQDFVSL